MISIARTRFSFWPPFALIVSGVIFLSILFLILDAPLPKSWDEAIYHNMAHYDRYTFFEKGPRKLLGALRYEDTYHPPAYRMFVLPFNLVFGVHPAALKIHSLVFWCLTLWLIYLTGKLLAGPDAGAFAAVYLAICPIIINTAEQFYTEYVLYFSIAAMLYSTTKILQSDRQRFIHWLALTASLTVGGLAKFSFFFMLAPFALILLILGWRDAHFKLRPLFLITSLACAGILISPWWIENFSGMFHFMLSVTTNFERHSLGHGVSFQKFLSWLKLVWWMVLGPGASWIMLLLAASFVLRQNRFKTLEKKVIWLCILTALPTLIITFSGTNNNPRYVGPALFPLALVLGLVASNTSWLGSWRRFLLIPFIIWQVAVMVWLTPGNPRYQKGDESKTLLIGNYTSMFRRPDQWDWELFFDLVSKKGFERPMIGELGQGSTFNPPQINYPWAKRNLQADVHLLWRYEMGPIRWDRVMEEAAQCHVVVTAPHYVGKKSSKFDLDNEHNAEFVQRLEGDGRFEGPIRLKIGKFDSVELAIFFRKSVPDAAA